MKFAIYLLILKWRKVLLVIYYYYQNHSRADVVSPLYTGQDRIISRTHAGLRNIWSHPETKNKIKLRGDLPEQIQLISSP